VLAGGTDLGLRITKRHEAPRCVLSLARVPDLAAVGREGEETVIGAAAPYADALESISTLAPSFGDLVRRIGATQIRAVGTIGGNLANASPIGDTIPPLIALGAEVELASRRARRTLPVEDFVTGYRRTELQRGEIILSIRIPAPDTATLFRVYKVARRVDQDIAAVSAAFALTINSGVVARARVAFGGVAERPLRTPSVERELAGRPWTLQAARAAGEMARRAVRPISDVRGSAAYRSKVCANLLERLWWDTAAPNGMPATLEALEGDAA
jgi:xanthine dehydrogenase small subunit